MKVRAKNMKKFLLTEIEEDMKEYNIDFKLLKQIYIIFHMKHIVNFPDKLKDNTLYELFTFIDDIDDIIDDYFHHIKNKTIIIKPMDFLEYIKNEFYNHIQFEAF